MTPSSVLSATGNNNTKKDVDAATTANSNYSTSTNFLVLSDAGKPIYARHGHDEDISRICGLLQALQSSVQESSSLKSSIRSLRAAHLWLVFLSVGSLTLVAIDDDNVHEGKNITNYNTEAYLRLQLEYIYQQIVFTVTARAVQDSFAFDPSFDLRRLLGSSTDAILNAILEESSSGSLSLGEPTNHTSHPGPYLVGGIETVIPISPALRARASSVLKVVGLKTPFTAFAILAVRDQLVTMVQPANIEHQMRVSDLQLLLKTVSRQSSSTANQELWMPVCLPRFSAETWLFVYTQCLDMTTGLCVVMVSQRSTTEQFQLFQEATATMRRSLDLASASESSVLEVLPENKKDNEEEEDSQQQSITMKSKNDIQWRRQDHLNEQVDDEGDDYVDASGDGDRMIPYLPSPTTKEIVHSAFLKDVRAACEPKARQTMLQQHCDIGSVLHFLFRFDARLQAAARQNQPGKLSQCLAPSLGFPFVDEGSQRAVWSTYQKLQLRLRQGSATSEATWNTLGAAVRQGTTGVDQSCPAVVLTDASPSRPGGISFVRDQTELYVGMNGPNYEL